MKYGVQYRNYLKGHHNILVFDKRKEAKTAYKELDALWNMEGQDENVDDEALQALYQSVFDTSLSVIEELDYRKIEEVMTDMPFSVNNNGYVSSSSSNIRIVNYGQVVDVPA